MIAEETRALLRRAQAGDVQAAERMVEENTGLIWSVARRFFGRGVEPDDLYQLGCVGFLKAMQGFDEQFGTCFSTYAVPKIAGEIRRFLRDDGAVKVSRSMKERAQGIRTARTRLEQTLGREPTLSELAAETGLEPEEIAAAETPPVLRNPCRGKTARRALRSNTRSGITSRRRAWSNMPTCARRCAACRSGSGR